MQEKILNYLKEKYNPDAIILHGSRARGMERVHSDWDFIFLYNNATSHKNGREFFSEQNIEFSVVTLPLQDIIGVFSHKLKKAMVLFERKNEGTSMLKEAEAIYVQGIHWSDEQIADHKLWFQGRIDGMRDNVDKTEIFYKYFSDLYLRIFNYWYFLKKHSYSEPVYVAVEEIGQINPVYKALVTQFTNSDSLEAKVSIAEQIRDQLFT